MNKKAIAFTASDQTLTKTAGSEQYASNTVSYVEATFTLGENWTGFDSVRAVWHSQYYDISTVLNAQGKCDVPAEVMYYKSKVFVNLVGITTAGDEISVRLTTYPILAFTVDSEALVEGTETGDITPSQFDQFVAQVSGYAEAAASSASNAEDSAETAEEAAQSVSESLEQIATNTSDIADLKATTTFLFSDPSIWVQGAIPSATGEDSTGTTRIRTLSYIDKSIKKIVSNAGYKHMLFAYDSGVYVGTWNGTSFSKSGNWHTNDTDISSLPNYDYRIVFANTSDSTITPSDGSHCLFSSNVDYALSTSGAPADAKTVGGRLSQNSDDIIKAELMAMSGKLDITYNDLEQGAFSGTNGLTQNSKTIRLKKTIFCKKGTEIHYDTGELYHVMWYMNGEERDPENIMYSVSRNLQSKYVVEEDCYIYMSFATGKTSGESSEITPSDFDGYSVTFISPSVAEKYDHELYIGVLDNVVINAQSAPSPNTKRASMTNCVTLPYGERTRLTVHINPPYFFGMRAGRIAQNLATSFYWYTEGDTLTFSDEQYYRCVIAKSSDPDAIVTGQNDHVIPLDEVYRAGLHIEYSLDDDTQDSEPYDRNADAFGYVVNSQNKLSASAHGGIGTYPVIVHASDFHGDRERLRNTLKVAERIEADCVVLSGDLVANKPYDRLDWMHELFAEFNGLPIICTGNHEVSNDSYTDAMVYDYMMKDSAAKIGNTNGTTYYYTDVASKKLRIIVCDIYQYGATTRSNTHMSTEQLTYICNALASTPADYGVIMVAHSPCVDVGNLADQNYSTFFQSLRKYGFTHYDIDGAPIYDIVDAFIARTTISRTYTQTGSPSSITATGDFTDVPSSVKFIAHLTGHIHEDSVCYLPTTQKQLMLNICCGCSMDGGSAYPYLADDCDLTRVPYGKMQDAINVYVIKPSDKRVRITRIGGTKTYDWKDREYMEIPFAD